MSGHDVGRFFDELSQDYTATIERCFPRYREMLWALLEYLPKEFPRILELGSGTGNLSVLLQQAFPTSQLTLVDVSPESLDVCRQRLCPDAPHTFCCQRFEALSFDESSFDLIVSSISIHHLDAQQKIALFTDAHRWLAPQGMLAFADQFRGVRDSVYESHIANWRALSAAAGGSEEEFAMWMQHQRDHDHHDTMLDQMDWIRDAGFHDVDCVWRYLLWAVLQARK